MKFAVVALVAAACGNDPPDYPPPPLADLGIHQAPTYVARTLMTAGTALLAHPRLGQPAIAIAAEPLDVGWIAPAAGPAADLLVDGIVVDHLVGDCDADGVCHAMTTVTGALGLHELCIEVGTARDCSPHALSIVDHRNDPATVVHLSDAHLGDGDSDVTFVQVLQAIAASPPDFVVFTGDGANDGLESQRAAFVADVANLPVPIYAVTGNHDYDNRGIDSHLMMVGPELDMMWSYGALRFIGLSSGQDLDDGGHLSTISESSGPDDSQLTWLATTLAQPSQPTVFFLHHPIYNALFATVGPESRDRLKALVTRDDALAVLAGHTHITSVYDAEGNSRDLSLDAQDVDPARLPLHYTAARATNGSGGYAVFHLSAHHVDYRWIGL
ncbi:MAG: metallophosphoesterase [Deltaproteobacteria bacterium]|nr:metallophosphoesterase [Deltaproteobacteria bacterium]